MPIWIRSQHRDKLVQCTGVAIFENKLRACFEILGYDAASIDNDHAFVLGSYSKEEKAMNVIDMIQNCLFSGPITIRNLNYKNNRGYDKGILHSVFQMPQDNEVPE